MIIVAGALDDAARRARNLLAGRAALSEGVAIVVLPAETESKSGEV